VGKREKEREPRKGRHNSVGARKCLCRASGARRLSMYESQTDIVNSQEFVGRSRRACAVRAIGMQTMGTNFYGPRPLC